MDIVDQIGHTLSVQQAPQRIVSLVPSQSELLVDLGLEDRLVGVTRFCTHPASLRKTCEVIGGTKDPDIDRILELQPDLIICNKEENRKEDVEQLQEKIPTYTSDVNTVDEALTMIRAIGLVCHSQHQSILLADQIQQGMLEARSLAAGRVAYLIWSQPNMVVSSSNFIHSMLEYFGLSNAFERADGRYIEVSDDEINAANPDYIFLSSEPYPFKEKNRMEFEKKFPRSKIILVDGRMFSWYGSCLTQSPKYLKSLCHQLV